MKKLSVSELAESHGGSIRDFITGAVCGAAAVYIYQKIQQRESTPFIKVIAEEIRSSSRYVSNEVVPAVKEFYNGIVSE